LKLLKIKTQKEVVLPERLELPTFWFEDMQYKTPIAAAGVAYGSDPTVLFDVAVSAD
jgi:hypothetical protein